MCYVPLRVSLRLFPKTRGPMTRRRLADGFIRVGLALQVVFLLFIDWATIDGFRREETLPWGHVVGLAVMNTVLLVAAFFAWRWMLRQQRESRKRQEAQSS